MSAPAPIFRGLTPTGDWAFGQGLSSYATGNAAIGLDIKTALQLFLGDAFWAANEGIDWFNLLGNRNTQDAILAAVRATIASRRGVTGISSVSSDLDRRLRALFLQASVRTVYSNGSPVTAQITV